MSRLRMSAGVRRAGTGIVGFALLVPIVGLTAGSADAVTPVPRCLASQMSAKTSNAEGAAGSRYVQIVFKNLTSHTCKLQGRPGVSFVAGADGHQVGASAVRNLDRKVTTVVLRAGGKAQAQLRIAGAANYPQGTCKPKPVRGLRVYPPGSTTSMFVKDPQNACSSTSVKQLTIDPVRHL